MYIHISNIKIWKKKKNFKITFEHQTADFHTLHTQNQVTIASKTQACSIGHLCHWQCIEASGPCAEDAQSPRHSCLSFWITAGSETRSKTLHKEARSCQCWDET